MCSIDPGERVFSAVYGTDGDAYLIGGDGDADKIDKLASIASRMRNGLKRIRGTNGGKKLVRGSRKTRKNLMKKAKTLESRTKNLITDIHRKTVKFLTNKYDTIIIPEFETQKMSTKRGSTDKWTLRKRKIGKGTTRRLIKWSHYKFRELLRAKGGTRVIVGTEEWTSKTCGKCFEVNGSLGGSRSFICPSCKVGIHRDLNGARNILTLNCDRMKLDTVYLNETGVPVRVSLTGSPVPNETQKSF